MKNNIKAFTLITAIVVCFMAFTFTAFADDPSISSIEPVNVTTISGSAPVLPATVTVTYSSTTTAAIAVTWDQADPKDFETVGFFTIEGTVQSTPIRAVANVTVTTGAILVDKSALSDLINLSEEAYDGAAEGDNIGQFPAGSKNVLLLAINSAKATLINEETTEDEVSAAITSINAALNKFNNLIITSITGDFNNSGKIELGDLGIIAGGYGIKAGDERWNSLMQDDINGDGEIGIYELAFIAKRIIGV